jgi:hypothetical protein
MSIDTSQEQENITLDDLNYFEAEDGLFIFFADREDICDVVENIGFQIYYLLCNKVTKAQTPANNNKHSNNNNNSKTYTSGPSNALTPVPSPSQEVKTQTIYKVCNSFVGRTIKEASITLPDHFISVSPLAHYTMPLIPHVIVEKLDQFFRLVDAQHGTESIVMLTYDLDKEGPEGWGVLVPDQQNTAAHCNYDPHSIAEIKPDNVMIVGSVHSHPHMAAYASGTDHADQADFDGIHITYGWQKSVNNGATQYHIELQMAGEAYTLKPEDVFEDFVIQKEPDPDVVEWSSKVKKELPPLHPTGGPAKAQALGNPPLTSQTPGKTAGVGSDSKNHWTKSKFFNSIKDQLETPCVIAYELPYAYHEVYANKINCLVCGVVLDHYSIVDHFCDICNVPVFSKNEPIQTVVEEIAYYCYQNKIDLNIPFYLVGDSSDGAFFVSRITPTTLKEYLNSDVVSTIISDIPEVVVEDIPDIKEVPDYQQPVCCTAVDVVDCVCSEPLTLKEFNIFLDSSKKYDFYDKNGPCFDCHHYMSESCPYLLDIACNYVSLTKKEPLTDLSELEAAEYIIDGTECVYFEKFNQYYDDNIGSLYYD